MCHKIKPNHNYSSISIDLAFNKPTKVDMPLDKETKPNLFLDFGLAYGIKQELWEGGSHSQVNSDPE